MLAALASCFLIASSGPTASRTLSEEWYEAAPPVVRRIALYSAFRMDEAAKQDKKPSVPDVAPLPSPEGNAKHSKDLADDVALGKEIAKEVAKEMTESKSTAMIDRVNRRTPRIGNACDILATC